MRHRLTETGTSFRDAGPAFLVEAEREWDALIESMNRLEGEGSGEQRVE